MAYENPNVCKEIYLPIEGWVDDHSPDEYKAKYGIDLRELFTLDSSGITLKSETRKHKLFVCTAEGIFQLIEFYDPDNLKYSIGAVVRYSIDFVGEAFEPLGVTTLSYRDGDDLFTYTEI